MDSEPVAVAENAAQILDLVVEDDYGLWEVLWRLCGREYDRALARHRAAQALKHLLRSGWVELMAREGPTGAPRALNADEVTKVLSRPESWEEPGKDARQVVVSVTPAGEAAYYRETS